MDRPARSPDMVSDRVHPLVIKAAGGLLVWFVAAAWLLFDDAGYMKLALVMISVLVFMALAIPAALLRTSVREEERNADATAEAGAADASEPEAFAPVASEPLGTWLQGRLATWTDQENSWTAAVEILLPLAAVAFGLTALGIVLEIARAGAV